MVELGIDEKKGLYDEYIRKWVVIYPHGINSDFSGKCIAIREGYAVLNPFQGAEIKEGRLVRKLIRNRGSSLVPLVGSAVEPTTEEHIIRYCKMINKKGGEKDKK